MFIRELFTQFVKTRCDVFLSFETVVQESGSIHDSISVLLSPHLRFDGFLGVTA